MALSPLLNKPKTNVIFMIAIVISSTLLIVGAASNDDNKDMAKLVVTWLPLMLAVATLLLYRISRKFFKQYNWIITLLGGMYILSASLQFYLA